MKLVSPTSGRELTPDRAHALTDGAGERWPVVDGIPFLRAGREALAAKALERLDADDRASALALPVVMLVTWLQARHPPRLPLALVRLIVCALLLAAGASLLLSAR